MYFCVKLYVLLWSFDAFDTTTVDVFFNVFFLHFVFSGVVLTPTVAVLQCFGAFDVILCFEVIHLTMQLVTCWMLPSIDLMLSLDAGCAF